MRTRIVFVLMTLILSVSFGLARAQTDTATPKTGGTLVVAAESMSDSLDIGFWQGFGALHVIDSIGEGLVRANFETGEVLPGLAESWTISPDGLDYVFKIRKGMVFQDGAPITAQAVVRSMKRTLTETDPSYIDGMYMYFNQGIDNWDSLEATDDLTVELKLKHANATQLLVFTRPDGYIISPTAMDTYKTEVGLHMSMAGPFKLDRFVPGQEAVLVANPDYWAGRPYLDQIIIRAYPDEASILAALQAGEVDITLYAPFDSVPRINSDQNDGLRIEVGAPLVDLYMGINVTKAPLDNVLVRQAINYAIDRDAIIQAGLAGMGQAPASILAPNDLGFDPAGRDISKYDPDKAKALLAEAGVTTPISLHLAFEDNRFWPLLGELISNDLDAVGFDITLDRLDTGTFNGKVSDGSTELAINQRSTFLPDPQDKAIILHSVNSPGGMAHLEALPKAKELDALIDSGIATSDPTARAAIYKQIQAMVLDEMPYVYLAYLTPPIFVRDRVQNVDTQGTAAGRVDFRGVWVSD